MKKLIYLLLLLPSIAFSCPILTGNYHCDVKKLDTGNTSSFDLRIETTGNEYEISILNATDIPKLKWVANGEQKSYIAAIPGGVIFHSLLLTCEDNKLHLIESQKWYHDQTPETLQTDDIPSRALTLSEFLSLDANGNLFRDDTWTNTTIGGSKIENLPLTCNKIKEEQK